MENENINTQELSIELIVEGSTEETVAVETIAETV